MEGSTPDWAEAEDYATLEEVFNSRTFGRALPEVAAVAGTVAAATAFPTGLARNRTIATFAVAAAALSVVAAVVTVGSGRPGGPLLGTQASGPSQVPNFRFAPQPTSPAPTGGGPAGGAGAGLSLSAGCRAQRPRGSASDDRRIGAHWASQELEFHHPNGRSA